jgi:hypothetical protein
MAHEQTEICAQWNEYHAYCRATPHPAQHGKSPALDPLDPFRATVCSNPLRNNRGTILQRYRACRTDQTRWVFLGPLGERSVHQYDQHFHRTKRNHQAALSGRFFRHQQVPFRRCQSTMQSWSLLDRRTPIQLQWVSGTSWFLSRPVVCKMQRRRSSF